MTSDSCTIGELARAGGVPTSTVRFYERTGLLKPSSRSDGNYRQYDGGAMERLKFIRSAQATGFSIEDIRELLGLTYSDDPPCREVLGLMENRLAEVRERLKKLRHVERVLAKSMAECCNPKPMELCEQLERMNGLEAKGKSCKTGPECPPKRGKASGKKKVAARA
jgi:DNA-binding transcriptional MerR regulator